ncbi:hypothetical protein AVEN_163358-1 [Araneus ventricosus]|uniref:DUF5641 domain-containing protein n=1 Tax=Araneus ventricosus TaxID=182803 RepID=A0A4Y2N4L6_ARAVE|nr:hypothetical protein AVEN_178241-1 [Araneus ventricosus]GBN34531.1 hypothetical protein AVEN_163358-1 [Araneus ventricosus]
MRPRWPSGKVSALGRRVPGSKPDSTEDPSCIGPVARQIIRRGERSSRWSGVEVWRGGASSGDEDGSKLRGTSQNSPRVASKRDVNIPNIGLSYLVSLGSEVDFIQIENLI